MTDEEKIVLRAALAEVANPVVVELGAYRGEDSQFLESLGTGEVLHIMVEPDPENCSVIGVDPRRKLYVGAVSARSEMRLFHFSDDEYHVRGSGSLLRPTGHLKHFPQITFHRCGPVTCYALDDIFRQERLERIDLLYVDVQGAEGEMIAGGKAALAATRYLFMEAELVEFYEGQATREALLAMLPGWTLVWNRDENVLLRNDVFTK